jgi:hypothetical protein
VRGGVAAIFLTVRLVRSEGEGLLGTRLTLPDRLRAEGGLVVGWPVTDGLAGGWSAADTLMAGCWLSGR